jgi:uncharacterized damage-inducible protein DinB
MNRNKHAVQLFQYHTWANARICDHLQTLPQEVAYTTIKSVFPTVFDVLVHVYIVDRGWYAVLTREYASDDYTAIGAAVNRLVQETRNNSLQEITAKLMDVSNKTLEFISAHDIDTMGWYGGVDMSLLDVIQHVVNHGSYHRGNISAMLHQLGYTGLPVDYGYYLYTLHNKK